MPKRNKNKKVRRQTQLVVPRGLRKSTPMRPGQFRTNTPYVHTFRFTSGPSSNDTAVPISVLDLLAVGGFYATSISTGTTWYENVKIVGIKIWTPCIQAYSSGSGVGEGTCAVIWAGSTNDANEQVSDTTNNVSYPAFVSSQPPPGSTCAFWLNQSLGTCMYITATPGSIIDITLNLRAGSNGGYAVSGFTNNLSAGSQYYGYLDGPAHSYFAPVGLAATNT